MGYPCAGSLGAMSPPLPFLPGPPVAPSPGSFLLAPRPLPMPSPLAERKPVESFQYSFCLVRLFVNRIFLVQSTSYLKNQYDIYFIIFI